MKINGLSTIIKVMAKKKKKIKKDKKEKAKKQIQDEYPEGTDEGGWPKYVVYPDEFKPLTEEQAKMTDKEFEEWTKSQGYY